MCPVSVVKVYEFILKINLKHNNYYKTHIAKKKIWLASICVKRKTWSGRVFYDNFKNVGLMCRNLPHWELEPPKNAIESIFFSMILGHMTKTKSFLLLSSSLLTFSEFYFLCLFLCLFSVKESACISIGQEKNMIEQSGVLCQSSTFSVSCFIGKRHDWHLLSTMVTKCWNILDNWFSADFFSIKRYVRRGHETLQ